MHDYAYAFWDPNGRPYTGISNLSQFCREHHLTVTALHEVWLGRYKHHRGWTKYTEGQAWSPPVRPLYVLIDPAGNVHRTHNLAQLAREQHLDDATLYDVWHNKAEQHKGWSRPYGVPERT